MKIGLFGGTFDPIHRGHLVVAEDARVKLGLDKMVFIPAGHPWLKSDRVIAAGDHRLEMVRLAVSSNPYFEVSALEIERDGPSYSVDTVEAMAGNLELEGEFYFVVGPDALSGLPRWKDPARLASLCQIVVVGRPNVERIDLKALESAVPRISASIRTVDVTQLDISSTKVRELVKMGQSVHGLIPSAVENYIHEYALYTD